MRTATSTIVAVAAVALVCLTAVHLFLPASGVNETVSTLPLIAHGLAFPLMGGLVLVVAGAVVLLVGLRGGRAGGPTWLPRAVTGGCIVVSGVLLLASMTQISLPTFPRGEAEGDGADMVMVSWNALDHFDGPSAKEIFGTLEADVAILPELQELDGIGGGATRIRTALAEGGLDAGDYDIFDSPPTGTHIAPLTVIVRRGFGAYVPVAVAQTTFGTVHLAAPEGSGLPGIIAVHTAPPVPRWMSEWRADLTLVRGLVDGAGANAIVAGDLNATVRHGSLGALATHGDVLAGITATQRGTWPAAVPQVLRSSIDHVLVPVDSCNLGDTRILDIPGSDHAAIVTTILLNG